MYDYLAKIILLGPSGSGKSCLLHRFVKNEFRSVTSQTIGVEFASRIVKIGGAGGRRKRVKLQLWDTAGTERFRSVSRSYYRGAAGAVLVYDLSRRESFAQLGTFLHDARVLASPQCAFVLAGNKADLAEDELGGQVDLLGDDHGVEGDLGSAASMSNAAPAAGLGSQQHRTTTSTGRAVPQALAAEFASTNRIPSSMEVSAFSGDGVEEVFAKLARTIVTKIELGEIDPDDPMSGIQYGDADFYRFDDGGSSIKSGLTADGYGTRRRRGRGGGWGDVFKVARPKSRGRCC